jgi:hypothetical protein
MEVIDLEQSGYKVQGFSMTKNNVQEAWLNLQATHRP